MIYFFRLSFEYGDKGDALNAITYAAGLSVRPTASKIMIVINCEHVFDKTIFGPASLVFKNQDITMHYLSPSSIQLRRKSKKAGHIFGLDSRTAYTNTSLNNPAGEPMLRNQLTYHKDFLTALATNSGGLVFSQQFLSIYSNERKGG